MAGNAQRPATPTEPPQWQLNRHRRWWRFALAEDPNFVYATTAAPRARYRTRLARHDARGSRARRALRTPCGRASDAGAGPPCAAGPGGERFRFRNPCHHAVLPPSARRVERTAEAAREIEAHAKTASVRTAKSRRQIGAAAVRQPVSPKQAAHQTSHAAPSRKGAPKHAAQAKPIKQNARAVRVAGLKKR